MFKWLQLFTSIESGEMLSSKFCYCYLVTIYVVALSYVGSVYMGMCIGE